MLKINQEAHSEQDLPPPAHRSDLEQPGAVPRTVSSLSISRQPAYIRSFEREPLAISVRLRHQEKETPGHTHDISPGGVRAIVPTSLDVGTPLALQCAFGELCYLNISGYVVFCVPESSRSDGNFAIGIKFSAIRDWEQKIVSSAITELKQSAETIGSSLLTIQVSEDTMALEAAQWYARAEEPVRDASKLIRRSCLHASKVIGWGSYLPPHEITNKDVNALLRVKGNQTKFGDVVGNLTGIQSRRYAASKCYPSDLAVEGSLMALKDAGIHPKDLEVIISCGVARDVEEPATAYIIQQKLGAHSAYVFDLANACNGFISAIDVLDSFIASGRCELGLVAVGDVLSQYVTWDAKSKKDLHMSSMSYTFGDGGGAAVLQRITPGDEQGIRGRWFLSDSSYWKVAVIPLMDTTRRAFKSNAPEIEHATLKHGPTGVRTVMEMLNWDIDDVDLIIPHQVSSHIIDNLFFKTLRIPKEKVYWSFPTHGNVGAASMPVALCNALQEGRLKSGDKVLLAGGSGGFGAGVLGLVI